MQREPGPPAPWCAGTQHRNPAVQRRPPRCSAVARGCVAAEVGLSPHSLTHKANLPLAPLLPTWGTRAGSCSGTPVGPCTGALPLQPFLGKEMGLGAEAAPPALRVQTGGSPANLRYVLLRPGEPREPGEPGQQRLVGAAPAGPPCPRAAPLPGLGRGASSAPQEPWGHMGPRGTLHPQGWASCVGSSCVLGLEQLHGTCCQHPQGQSHRSPPAATLLSPCSLPAPPAGLASAQTGLYWQGGRCCTQPPPALPCPPFPGAARAQPPVPAAGADVAPGTSSASGSAPRALWGRGCRGAPAPGLWGELSLGQALGRGQ